MPNQTVGKPQRQIGHGANIDRNDVELIGTVEIDSGAEQAEAGIVDDIFDLDPGRRQRRGNLVTGIGQFEIAGNHDRRRATGGCEFAGQRGQAVGPARHQREPMAFRRENARELRAYSR